MVDQLVEIDLEVAVFLLQLLQLLRIAQVFPYLVDECISEVLASLALRSLLFSCYR